MTTLLELIHAIVRTREPVSMEDVRRYAAIMGYEIGRNEAKAALGHYVDQGKLVRTPKGNGFLYTIRKRPLRARRGK